MTEENAGLSRLGVITWLMVFLIAHSTHSAPVHDEDTTQVAEYEGAAPGCYYNFQYYEEGDRIMTNEPCLNCTCHNRMLMCYLRVCPQFTKAIGQNCQVEKRPDQCCPVITCPEVPVHLLTSTTSAPSSSSSDSTEVGFHDNYGCSIDNKFYADGAQLPTDPNNPCELCYCIRNRTTCTMQQCTLKIARCSPVFHPGICCPVKYDCDYDEEPTTTPGTTPGLIMTTTMAPGIESPKCTYQDKLFNDGDLLYSTEPCHHCYCLNGGIACAIQECGKPMETHGKNCTAVTPPEGECCPTTYKCDDESGSIEGEEQQQVTHDGNEIVATQATLPTEQVDEDKQSHEAVFPGADNAIPEDHQVQEEVSLDSSGAELTTQAGVIENQPTKITTTPETDEVAVNNTVPTQVPDDNAVPGEPIEVVTHGDEATQYTEEFIPTESTVLVDSVEHDKFTTIVEDMETTKSPEETKSEGVTPVADTEAHTEPSGKLSTSLPARSEDQVPVEPQTTQPGEISTHLPRSEDESTETSLVTEPVTSEVNKKPVTTVPESNEIPVASKGPTGDIATKPGDTATTSGAGVTGEMKPEEMPTESSISETPKISEEDKPVTVSSKTELSKESEEKSTVQPDNTPDITNKIPQPEPTGMTGEELKPEGSTTITPASEFTSTKHEEPATEAIEPEVNDIPTQGPPGIEVPTRGPVTKAEDNDSVPEVQVTEGYEKNPSASEMQTPENLMTEKPGIPLEVSSETVTMVDENITVKPQIPQEQPATSVTETPITKPEEQTSSEDIHHTPPIADGTQATEVPSVEEEESTVASKHEGTIATSSTEITEVDVPTKGIQVSGELSSEEATSSEAPTTGDVQPDSAESSSEEDGEEPSSPVTLTEHPASTMSSSEAESENAAEQQVTVLPEEKKTIAPTEHEILTEEVPMETATEAKPSDENPVEESSTEKSTEVQTVEVNPTEEQPMEEKTTENPMESEPAVEATTSEGLTEVSPVEQSEGEKPFDKSTVQPMEEHPIQDTQTQEKVTERPVVEQPTGDQTPKTETTEVQSTEKSAEAQPAEEQPSGIPMEVLPTVEKGAEEKSTDKSSNAEPTELTPLAEEPTEIGATGVQLTTETPTKTPPSALEPTEEQPSEMGPIEEQLTTVPPTETQQTEKSTSEPAITEPSKSQLAETETTAKPIEQSSVVISTDEKPTDGKPIEEPTNKQPEHEMPAEERPVESQTEQGSTDSDDEVQTTEAHPLESGEQTEPPHKEPITVGIEIETSSSSPTEPLPSSIPVDMEQTGSTETAEEVTEPSVTSVSQDLSTEVITSQPTSEEAGEESSEQPVATQDTTEKEASEQPVVEVRPEAKPEESVEPTEDLIPTSEHTEPSIAEQSSTGIKTSEDSEKPQTLEPTTPEEIKPTEESIDENESTEQSLVVTTESSKLEPEQQSQTMSSPGIELQTMEAMTESVATEGTSIKEEEENEGDVQQTSIPSIISVETSEMAVTETASTEKPAFTDLAAPEEKPKEESELHPTEMSTLENRTTEATKTEVTFPESNELPGQTQTEFKPEEQSTEKIPEASSLPNEPEIPIKPVLSKEEYPSISTDGSISDITSTERISETEATHTSVPEQQPNEEPPTTTKISPEVSTTIRSDLSAPHAEEKPIEPTKDHTIASIPVEEQTPEIPTESVTISTMPAENGEAAREPETPTSQDKSQTEPATVSDELPVSNEQPHKVSETSSTTEPVIPTEGMMVDIEQQTEKPDKAQDGEPTEEELPSAVTSAPTTMIGKETTPSISAETETPVAGEPIITDAPVSKTSESTTKLSVTEANSEVTSSTITPSTEPQPEPSTETSSQTIEFTEQPVEVKPISTQKPEEPSLTTSGEFKPSGIPGEGNCLIDGESFTNNSEIPPANPCQVSCHCVSSIVQCELVQCPPPPSHLSNCMPIHTSSDACCPMYSCDASPTATLEADNQMAGHSEPEEQGQEQKTESSAISGMPVEESKVPEEPTKHPEEHTTAPVITEESTSVTLTEIPITSEPTSNVPVEQPSNVTPKVTSGVNEPTENPVVVTEEVTTENEVSSTSLSMGDNETTKPTETVEEQTAPPVDNRVGETDSATSVPKEEKPTKVELTTISQVPESGEEVTMTITPEHSTAPEEAHTESEMVGIEGVKEPTTSIEFHETVSSATGEPSGTEAPTEPSLHSTSVEQKPVEDEEATTISAETTAPEKETVEESSVQPQEQTPSSEHSNEVTPPTQKLPTEPALVELTGASQPEPDTTVPQSGTLPTVLEHTTTPVVSEADTIATSHKESGTESTEGTPVIEDTEIPSVHEEHKQVESSETPQTEMTPQKTEITPQKTEITPEIDGTSTISVEHSTAGEQSTTVSSSEGTFQPSVTAEESGIITKEPDSFRVPTEPSIAVETSTPVEHTLSTESPSQPSTELSSSIPPGILEEHSVPTVTETSEAEITKPVTIDSNNIPSSESEAPTSAPSAEVEPAIDVTEKPLIETDKPEEHETATAIPVTTQTQQVSEESSQTISSTAVTTQDETTESQSITDETEKSSDVTSAASVQTDLPTEVSPTRGPEPGVEGTKNVTKPSELETPVTEVILSEEASKTSSPTEQPAGSEPSPTEETSSQNVNIPVITENPEGETRPPVDEPSSTSTSLDSTQPPETPSGEQPSSSEAPLDTPTMTSEEEISTEVAERTTETAVIQPAIPTEIPVAMPEEELKPTETSVEQEKETEIKAVETSEPMIVNATTHIPQEGELVKTPLSQEHTPTIPPVIPESSPDSQEALPTVTTVIDEKPTEINEQQPMKPDEVSDAQSQATEATTLPTVDESSSQTPPESSSESTQASIIPISSEETSVTESKPTEVTDQTIPEAHSVEPVDKATTTSPSLAPSGEIQGNEVPELPMSPEQQTDTEGQQTISPIEPEVVQEHVTESDKNITSPHHTYVPPSSTESPTGGEYPDQSVSGEDNPHFPVHGGTQLEPDEDYEEDDQAVYGPGTCRYGGKVYVSAQQIPRDDPCDFCFCFRSDIICLQQSCPPPIPGCHEEPIGGFCCPRYECPVSMATSLNITTTTTTTTTTLPPHFLSHAYKGATRRNGCQIGGQAYKVGEVIQSTSGPCLHCTCGGDGNMKCEPRVCSPEPMIRQMIGAATAKRRR